MPPDIRDVRSSRRTENVAEQRRSTFRQIQAAAVQADKLTGDPKWDFFLRRVQAIINQLQPVKEQIEQTLPQVYNDQEVRRLQLLHCVTTGQLNALKQVIDMPREMLDDAQAIDDFMAGKLDLEEPVVRDTASDLLQFPAKGNS